MVSTLWKRGRNLRGLDCDVIVKVVTLFLIFIAVMAMFGRLRFPDIKGRIAGLKKPKKCRSCGTFRVGSGACPCGKG